MAKRSKKILVTGAPAAGAAAAPSSRCCSCSCCVLLITPLTAATKCMRLWPGSGRLRVLIAFTSGPSGGTIPCAWRQGTPACCWLGSFSEGLVTREPLRSAWACRWGISRKVALFATGNQSCCSNAVLRPLRVSWTMPLGAGGQFRWSTPPPACAGGCRAGCTCQRPRYTTA